VEMGKAVADLEDPVDDHSFRDLAAFWEVVENFFKGFSVDAFHNDVQRFILMEFVVDILDKILMLLKLYKLLELAFKLVAGLLVLDRLVDPFVGKGLFSAHIFDEEHFSKVTLSKVVLGVISRELGQDKLLEGSLGIEIVFDTHENGTRSGVF